MKNVSRAFTGVFGMAAGFIIGTVWSSWESRRNNVEPIKYQKSRPAVSDKLTNVQDLVFRNFDDVCDVLSQMDDTITKYGAVSVADFCDIVGVTSKHIDTRYGWYNTNNMYIERKSDGFIIHLPEPIALYM